MIERVMIGRGLDYFKIWLKIFWIKCEPLNGIQGEKHTDNATLNHYFTVSLQAVFRFSYYFFSLTEPPKTEILYVYIQCVHIYKIMFW